MNNVRPMQIDAGDLLVFSHLRWDFVFQRPQHVLSRMSKSRRVFFFEEPEHSESGEVRLQMRQEEGVTVVVPQLPVGLSDERSWHLLRYLVDLLISDKGIRNFTAWYYTPMALPFTQHLKPASVVYDCMDELSLFKGAHGKLLEFEANLFKWADVVFTGGHSLYETKAAMHDNIHPIPSSIDVEHFSQARSKLAQPEDQKHIAGKKIGFFGVVDERMDIELVEGVARLRPDWNIIIIGPVIKIDPAALPVLPNIHYLGKKSYKDLPNYIAGWDLAFLPFARNNATRFISPTKTPEYLAAGKPVVSTSIRDVVRPYSLNRLVHIANTPAEFIEKAELAMDEATNDASWLPRVDNFLSQNSWDKTCHKMSMLEREARHTRQVAASLVRAVTDEYETRLRA